MKNRWALMIVTATIAISVAANCQAQNELVLRDLRILDNEIVNFDSDGVQTRNSGTIGWDLIHSGKTVKEKQPEFDQHLKEIGEPLFRARHRMLGGDWGALDEPNQKLAKLFADDLVTKSNFRTRYLKALASFCGNLHSGRREQSVQSFVKACHIYRQFPAIKNEQLPQGMTTGELEGFFTAKLLPVWFDTSAASQSFDKLIQNSSAQTPLVDGELIYLTTLAIAAQKPKVQDLLSQLKNRSSTIVKRWRPIIEAQHEIQQDSPGEALKKLQSQFKRFSGPHRGVANFVVGLASSKQEKGNQADRASLELLHIPATFGGQQPHLSAAALYEAARISDDAGLQSEVQVLHTELKTRFPNTHHARLLSK